jgi:drug/metabolite transporter (DMT)-like permease
MVTGLDYFRPVWAGGLGYLFFNAAPERIDVLGKALIVACGLVIVIREARWRDGWALSA